MNADTGTRRDVVVPAPLTPSPSPSRWRDFVPAPMAVDARERWRAVAGAALGVLFTALLCGALAPVDHSLPWLVAPIGASAVLVFAAPSSPFAHPWSVIGGNTQSALVAIVCVHLFGSAGTAAWVTDRKSVV